MLELKEQEPDVKTLGASARASLLWSGGFTLLRDVLQFVVMLILVRLLSPNDYGVAALAQSILGLVSVASFATFAMHILQARDPGKIDWQVQFTAAAAINSFMFGATLLIAFALTFTRSYSGAAWPLAGLATAFLIEVPATMRHRMLEANHDWKRFRLLLAVGTFLGSAAGLVVALLGGGVWALVIQTPLFGIPAIVDLFWFAKWRPDWSWSWSRYRETAEFGFNRMGSAAVVRGRVTAEQSILAGVYDMSALGIFTRSIGLATLIAGRIGSVATMSLYPVVTRAEQGSEQFRRYSGLVLRGVTWSTVATAVFLAVSASDVVSLLYGAKWTGVAAFLPLAVAGVSFAGMAAAVNSMLLANNALRASLVLDLVSAAIAVGLAFALVPRGVTIYLAALVLHGTIVLGLSLYLLLTKRGISVGGIWNALVPAAIAGVAGVVAVFGSRAAVGVSHFLVLRLSFDLAAYLLAFVLVLRVCFLKSLRELLEVAPGGPKVAQLLFA